MSETILGATTPPVRRRAGRDADQAALAGRSAVLPRPVGRRLVEQPDSDPTSRSNNGARALVIGCGALARELLAVAERVPGLDVACLSPDLHNRPAGIPGAVRDRIGAARREGYERIFVAYADCGTGGLLEPVLATEGVERLPGAHCYEVFAGSAEFAALAEAEPGTFWLTDFLARNFERLVIRGLGIDRHPELQATYFANYTRVVFLSQTEDPDLLVLAQRAADRLGLAFEHRPTGMANLAAPIYAWASRSDRDPRGRESGSDLDSRGASQSGQGRRESTRSRPESVGMLRGARIRSTSGVESVESARGARLRGTLERDSVEYARGARTADRAP